MTEIPGTLTTSSQITEPPSEYIRVTITDADQPYHCSLIAANQEKTWGTENYTDLDGARDAIAWLGRFTSPADQSTVYVHSDGTGAPYAGWMDVWLDRQELGEKFAIPIFFHDQRTKDE